VVDKVEKGPGAAEEVEAAVAAAQGMRAGGGVGGVGWKEGKSTSLGRLEGGGGDGGGKGGNGRRWSAERRFWLSVRAPIAGGCCGGNRSSSPIGGSSAPEREREQGQQTGESPPSCYFLASAVGGHTQPSHFGLYHFQASPQRRVSLI
jgi:hypothetical protein